MRLLIFLLIIGCRVDKIDHINFGAEDDAKLPKAEESLNLYPDLNPDNIPIGFGDPYESHMAQCIKTPNHTFNIVDKSPWETLENPRRKALILHELGHCVFNLGHDSALDQEGNPVTAMYPDWLEDAQASHFIDNESEYIADLYNRANSKE